MDTVSQTAVLGGGCFWCTEAVFKSLRGVVSVTPGYSGGSKPDPTYEEVCSGNTGFVEVVKLEFDPSVISFRNLLEVFFATHDPTSVNKQGSDIGEQYASVIFYETIKQKNEAELFIKLLESEKIYDRPIVTKIRPLSNFYEAEQYHRNYYENNPAAAYCQAVVSPKLEKLRQKFASLLNI